MKRFIEGLDRSQATLLPDCIDDYVTDDNPVRAIDAFIDMLDLAALGFDVEPESTGRPGYHPATMLKIYVYGYLCNLELIWLTGQLKPDFSQSKLIVSYLVGDRSGDAASRLMDDLRMRLANRVQLTTDGHKAYLEAVEGAFGDDVDYAMLIKLYGNQPSGPETRYSPAECIGARKTPITGDPEAAYISTSHVERSNLSMRMHMRRFTRLTNAHSKRITAHIHMVALYTVFYNFIRIHKTLRVSPAMASGIASSLMTFEDIVAKMDAIAPKPGRPKTYRKRVSV